MPTKSLFEKLADNEIPNWKIWEDDKHMAFLTPFPNTPGQVVVAPKKNLGDDAFELSNEEYQRLLLVAKKVVKIMKKALGVDRVALVIEGIEVSHVHIKLYPLYINKSSRPETSQTSAAPQENFFPEYIGHLRTIGGPKMPDEELDKMQAKLQKVASEVL